MSKYTLEERLHIYEKALNNYTRSDDIIYYYGMDEGFCKYFWNNLGKITIKEDLPELYKTRPLKFIILGFAFTYWFKEGSLKPRIKCLKKAIKSCRKQLYGNRDTK